MNSEHAHGMLVQDLMAQIDQAATDRGEKAETKASESQAKGDAEGDLMDTTTAGSARWSSATTRDAPRRDTRARERAPRPPIGPGVRRRTWDVHKLSPWGSEGTPPADDDVCMGAVASAELHRPRRSVRTPPSCTRVWSLFGPGPAGHA